MNVWVQGVITDEDSEGLYVRTGFQQLVQGKRGENWGENRVLYNIFVLCYLEEPNAESSGTRRLVWKPKCIFCTIAFGVRNLSNRTGTRNRVRTLGQCPASKQVAKKGIKRNID